MFELDEDLQKELTWASGALVAFLILLVYGGTSEPTEIAIAVGAFAVSWLVISYSVKNLDQVAHPRKICKRNSNGSQGYWLSF